jgi:hypothetical protein
LIGNANREFFLRASSVNYRRNEYAFKRSGYVKEMDFIDLRVVSRFCLGVASSSAGFT